MEEGAEVKIGLGVITCNREDFFQRCFSSINRNMIDELVVVNDGEPYSPECYNSYNTRFDIIQHDKNKGVGISKNDAMKYLLSKGCDYIFLIEDDITILNNDVFQKYIELHKISNIHHFNFGYHGPANKLGKMKHSVCTITYSDTISMALNHHCVGAFCFYTREILEKVGLMDEKYLNAFEHVSHDYDIIKAGYAPPFWYFADLANSDEYLNELACSEVSSVIRPRSDWKENIQKAAYHFRDVHGCFPTEIPVVHTDVVIDYLRKRKA